MIRKIIHTEADTSRVTVFCKRPRPMHEHDETEDRTLVLFDRNNPADPNNPQTYSVALTQQQVAELCAALLQEQARPIDEETRQEAKDNR